MRCSPLLAAIPLALYGCGCPPLNVPIDAAVLNTDGSRPEEGQFLELDIGRGVRLPARIAVTTKGNGTLKAPGLCVHVIDLHQDGAVFEGGQLAIRLVDVNGDGYRDLLTYGMRIEQGDDEPGKRRVAVSEVCLFDPAARRFMPSPPSTPASNTASSASHPVP